MAFEDLQLTRVAYKGDVDKVSALAADNTQCSTLSRHRVVLQNGILQISAAGITTRRAHQQ